MRITLLSLLLLLFTGCADDLVGPDAAVDGPAALAQTSPDEAVRTSRPPSVAGTWQASDDSGSIRLYIGEISPSPDVSTNAVRSIEGKGIISAINGDPLFVEVEGTYKLRNIAFTLSDAGGTIAKAEGEISRDFSLIKVVLYDGSDDGRTVLFERF